MEQIKYIVYTRLNEKKEIVEVNSSAFLQDTSNWIQIDEGTDGKIYGHAQPNYLQEKYGKPTFDQNGKPNFKYENGKVIELSKDEKVGLPELKTNKIQELSTICNQTIMSGVDVELSIGNKHFSLTTEDQLNLFGKQAQIASGLERFEYHADGEPCVYFSKEDMMLIIQTAMTHVSYHTTYFNSLKTWIESVKTKDELENINYGSEIPTEYQSEVLKEYIILMGL